MANLNKKTLVWIIIALLAMNIASMVGHFIRHSNVEQRQIDDRKTEEEWRPRSDRMDGFIKREVGFSDSQMDSLKQIRRKHMQETQALNIKIHKLRKEIMDRAFEANPKDSTSEELLTEIGLLQTELERMNQEHFLSMGKLCKPEQRDKLKKVFGEAVGRQKPKYRNWDRNHDDDDRCNRKRKKQRRDRH